MIASPVDLFKILTRCLIFVNFCLLVSLVVSNRAVVFIQKRTEDALTNFRSADENICKLKDLSVYLEKLESELAAFFALSPDLLVIANNQGYFVKLNHSWTQTLGWTLEELRAEPYICFVHPEDKEKTLHAARINETSALCRFYNRYRHKDGSYRLLSWSASQINKNGETYAIARDITEANPTQP